MTVIDLKKKKMELVNEMGRIDSWLSDLVGHLKKVRTEKERKSVYDTRRQRVDRKIEIQAEIREINIQIQEETERLKEEAALSKLQETEGTQSNNDYLRLILDELRKLNEKK